MASDTPQLLLQEQLIALRDKYMPTSLAHCAGAKCRLLWCEDCQVEEVAAAGLRGAQQQWAEIIGAATELCRQASELAAVLPQSGAATAEWVRRETEQKERADKAERERDEVRKELAEARAYAEANRTDAEEIEAIDRRLAALGAPAADAANYAVTTPTQKVEWLIAQRDEWKAVSARHLAEKQVLEGRVDELTKLAAEARDASETAHAKQVVAERVQAAGAQIGADWQARAEKAERERDEARKELTEIEEREAASCPEDMSFDECITMLRKKWHEDGDRADRAEAVLKKLCENLTALLDSITDHHVSTHLRMLIMTAQQGQAASGTASVSICPYCKGSGHDAHLTRAHGTPPLPCRHCDYGKALERAHRAGQTQARASMYARVLMWVTAPTLRAACEAAGERMDIVTTRCRQDAPSSTPPAQGPTIRQLARMSDEDVGLMAEAQQAEPPQSSEPSHTQPRTHELKTWPEFYSELLAGRKTFEMRRDDRGFRPGDELRLREWEPRRDIDDGVWRGGAGEYTGREERFRIGYVLRNHEGIAPGFAVLSLLPAAAPSADVQAPEAAIRSLHHHHRLVSIRLDAREIADHADRCGVVSTPAYEAARRRICEDTVRDSVSAPSADGAVRVTDETMKDLRWVRHHLGPIENELRKASLLSVLDRAIAALSAAPLPLAPQQGRAAQPDWIRCSDRMPSPMTLVQCSYRDDSGVRRQGVRQWRWKSDGTVEWSGYAEEPSHWKPLSPDPVDEPAPGAPT